MNISKIVSAKTFKSLCTPAQLYFGLSVLSFIALIIQNCTDPYSFCIGSFSAPSPIHNASYFIVKTMYILFWTWIINKACTKGWNKLAWLIVLFPFIAMFVLLGLLMVGLQREIIKKKQ
uniref:Uncharacterized protein n=1 Tax=viral metagenome TaxID=1070528 RepID=A0A6C0C533_9ZZZZ